VFNKNTAAKRVDSVHLPVLILAGDLDVPFIVTTSGYLNKHIAGSQMRMVNGVAHLINLEKPEEFNGIVGDFLKK
jgi:pimeloyl-ACP methyl ester carboxylesterase